MAPTVGGERGRRVVIRRINLADQVWRGRLRAADLACRNEHGRLVEGRRLSPSFSEKQGAEAVAHFVLNAAMVHVQTYAIDFSQGRFVYHDDAHQTRLALVWPAGCSIDASMKKMRA